MTRSLTSFPGSAGVYLILLPRIKWKQGTLLYLTRCQAEHALERWPRGMVMFPCGVCVHVCQQESGAEECKESGLVSKSFLRVPIGGRRSLNP